MPEDTIRIDISKEYLSFSAGHFTLFSATERENLHGHNFRVRCSVTAALGPDGMAFDYVALKRVLKGLCDALDERVLLPERSPYLRLERQDGMVVAHFAGERIPFLERDCLTLAVRNITIEELAGLLLRRLLDSSETRDWDLRTVEISVSSGSGQWATASSGGTL